MDFCKDSLVRTHISRPNASYIGAELLVKQKAEACFEGFQKHLIPHINQS